MPEDTEESHQEVRRKEEDLDFSQLISLTLIKKTQLMEDSENMQAVLYYKKCCQNL